MLGMPTTILKRSCQHAHDPGPIQISLWRESLRTLMGPSRELSKIFMRSSLPFLRLYMREAIDRSGTLH